MPALPACLKGIQRPSVWVGRWAYIVDSPLATSVSPGVGQVQAPRKETVLPGRVWRVPDLQTGVTLTKVGSQVSLRHLAKVFRAEIKPTGPHWSSLSLEGRTWGLNRKNGMIL